MPVPPIHFHIFVVPASHSAAALVSAHISPVLLVPAASNATALHSIYAVPVLLFSFFATSSPSVVLVVALTLLIPGDTSQLAIGDLLALLPIVASVNMPRHLPSISVHLAPVPGSANMPGPFSVIGAFPGPTALLVPLATSAYTSAVMPVVPMLVVTIVVSERVIEQIAVASAVAHDGHDIDTLVSSLGGVETRFLVLVQFFHSVSHGGIDSQDPAMQIDDPDHPMADDSTEYIVESTQDNMDIDEDGTYI